MYPILFSSCVECKGFRISEAVASGTDIDVDNRKSSMENAVGSGRRAPALWESSSEKVGCCLL